MGMYVTSIPLVRFTGVCLEHGKSALGNVLGRKGGGFFRIHFESLSIEESIRTGRLALGRIAAERRGEYVVSFFRVSCGIYINNYIKMRQSSRVSLWFEGAAGV